MSKETLRGLERGLSVLAALERHDGLALRELHRLTSLPKPTLLRILATLQTHGYARRRIGDGTWRRTARQPAEPASRLERLLLDIGGEVLDELCRRVIWPSDLAVYRDGAMQILETSRRLTPFVINRTGIGLRVPILQSGLGRAWLTYCPAKERETIIATLLASDDPFDRLARESGEVETVIAETRAKGYGVRAKEYQPRRNDKTSGIAVPVFAGGRIIAAVNMVWIQTALDEETFVRSHLDDLRETADRIGRQIARELTPRKRPRPA